MILITLEWEEKSKAMIPWEINNQFLTSFFKSWTKESKFNYELNVGFSDFWKVIVKPDRINQFISHYQALKDNIDEIVKICPLPKEMSSWSEWAEGFKYARDKEWNVINITDTIRETTPDDIRLLADVIIDIAKEAKEQNKYILFRWEWVRYNWEWEFDYFQSPS